MSDTELLSGDPAAPPTDGTDGSSAKEAAPRRRGGLSAMVLADLRELAGQVGIPDTAGMRKNDLIAAIKERQSGSGTVAPARRRASTPAPVASAPVAAPAVDAAPVAAPSVSAPPVDKPAAERTSARAATPDVTAAPAAASAAVDAPSAAATPPAEAPRQDSGDTDRADSGDTDQDQGDRGRGRRRRGRDRDQGEQQNRDNANRGEQQNRDNANRGEQQNRDNANRGEQQNRDNANRGEQGSRNNDRNQDRNQGRAASQNNDRRDDEDDEDGGRRRGRRFRDRNRRGGRERTERSGGGGDRRDDVEIREDDVLLPVAGILDVLDNYAFVRTSGYLAGPNDVYVSLSLVRKHGLRRGDAVTGAVRQPREGEQPASGQQPRQKFNPLVRIDTINGLEADQARNRPDFTKLTPLYPNERLRLETEPGKLTGRVIDLIMPIGKGQRALIVSPPKAGKTTIMQEIANAITRNNPECHLMVVLVDERPEEVTDMQRSVKGEVIASTFDRPPSDHTSISELAIERAKRLVEMGHDVVVLLDNITRLGRAYNLAAPASGRILSGGVDSTALYPPKRFLGAARNIEDGGSLTIFATALVETGSTMDTVIFEEFKGTSNAELKLDRKIADKRTFPAIDVNPSSTRKDELLLSPDELAISHKLRQVLSALDSQQAINLLLDRLRKTRTNIEFLMQVSKSTPGGNNNNNDD